MDSKELTGWKQRYNEYLMRYFKAVAFLDNPNIPLGDKDKWTPEFQNVLNELNHILSIFDADGIKYTFDESMGGFDVEPAQASETKLRRVG